ncbi:MAG: hypothetical protein WC450_04080 [Candidatus Omnitrophota bacterium]|jgi:hypothetical protein
MESPDNVCEQHSNENINLNICVEDNMVFIKGDRISLCFLSKLLMAQAEFEGDDGFQISPFGAGRIFFDSKSKYGVYIHNSDQIKKKVSGE